MAKKLNSMRLLDSHGIAYEVLRFPDTIHSAQGVAEYVGVPAAQVYKTLVLMNARHKPLLVMVAADQEVRVKRVAQIVGDKKLRMATHKEAETVTGLRVGGISALALQHKGFPVYIDQQATRLDTILLSAGQRGVNLRLPLSDLLRVTRATVIAATLPPAPSFTASNRGPKDYSPWEAATGENPRHIPADTDDHTEHFGAE